MKEILAFKKTLVQVEEPSQRTHIKIKFSFQDSNNKNEEKKQL